MQKRFQFLSTILTTVVCGTLVAGLALAVTTIGTNITTAGDLTINTDKLFVNATSGNVGIGTTSPSSKLDIRPGTANGINIATLNQNNQKGINMTISAATDGVFAYGLYNTINVGNGTPSDWRIAYGVYNDISVDTSWVGIAAVPTGISNRLTVTGDLAQISGIETRSSGYPTSSLTTQDAFSTALYAGGANGTIRGERLELFLKNDDGLTQTGYGTKMAVHALGSGDSVYGFYMDDTASGVIGGTEYGIYLALDDADATRYGIYETGGAKNYFAGNVGIGDATPAALFTVGTSDAFQINSSGNISTSGTLAVGSGTAITKHTSTVTSAIDLGTLAIPGCSTATAAVTGAAVGDTVQVVPSADGAAWDTGNLSAFVESAATVKIVYCTPTAGDPASMTYRIDLWQH
jgi:hypothetical protein